MIRQVHDSHLQYPFNRRPLVAAVYTYIRRIAPLALILWCAGSDAANALPQFEAIYTVRLGPLRGTMLLRLSRYGDGYVYETSLEPRGIASIFRRGIIYETTYLVIEDRIVRPVNYTRTDTIADPVRTAYYFFDNDRVGGIYKSGEVDFPMREGGQNRISAHVAMMLALRNGEPMQSLPVFDRSRWKDYAFSVVPGREVRTKSGTFETVELRFSSPGDEKGSSIFFAPALGFLPVQIEYFESGDVKSRATLDEYQLMDIPSA